MPCEKNEEKLDHGDESKVTTPDESNVPKRLASAVEKSTDAPDAENFHSKESEFGVACKSSVTKTTDE